MSVLVEHQDSHYPLRCTFSFVNIASRYLDPEILVRGVLACHAMGLDLHARVWKSVDVVAVILDTLVPDELDLISILGQIEVVFNTWRIDYFSFCHCSSHEVQEQLLGPIITHRCSQPSV